MFVCHPWWRLICQRPQFTWSLGTETNDRFHWDPTSRAYNYHGRSSTGVTWNKTWPVHPIARDPKRSILGQITKQNQCKYLKQNGQLDVWSRARLACPKGAGSTTWVLTVSALYPIFIIRSKISNSCKMSRIKNNSLKIKGKCSEALDVWESICITGAPITSELGTLSKRLYLLFFNPQTIKIGSSKSVYSCRNVQI
jgi:hypothetical protein